MTQYIDKAAIVAEIEKQGTIQPQLSWFTDKLIQIINSSVEVKEVDLKKEIDTYFDNYEIASKEECYLTHEQACAFAKHFFELGIKAAQKGE